MKRLPLLTFAALSILSPGEAAAYRTASALPELSDTTRIRWRSAQASFDMFAAPSMLAIVDIEEVLRGSLETWSASGCAVPMLGYLGRTPTAASAGDWRNTIEWVVSGWTARGYDAQAAAVTHTQYEREGEEWAIVEADIYLNAENFDWLLNAAAGSGFRDVLSVLTHEMGHALGLLHPCEPDGRDGAPVCTSDTQMTEATMFPIYNADQSTLADDDIAGACFLYGTLCDQMACGEGSACIAGECHAVCGTATCAVGEACEAGRCVPVEPGLSCTQASQCLAGEQCIFGACEQVSSGSGSVSAGDPCSDDAQCESGICADAGHCELKCWRDADCGSGQRCETSRSGNTCVGGLPLGAPCEDSGQCLGGICLAGAGDTALCTRSCGGGCPSDWPCTTVDADRVCAPADFVPRGGCSIQPVSSQPAAPLVLTTLFIVTALRRRFGAKS